MLEERTAMKKFEIDARDLACPKPLLRTKQAIETEEFEMLTVLVSNVPARENVTRFLSHAGFQSVSSSGSEESGEIRITAVRGDLKDSSDEPARSAPRQGMMPAVTVHAGGKTVLVASDRIGMGKKELGRLLLKGYIYTLTQFDTPPRCLIFMNTGVKLTLDDSDSLEDLKILAEKGVEILVCGTCLDYLNVRERMMVGRISNMYEIAGMLHGNSGVISFT